MFEHWGIKSMSDGRKQFVDLVLTVLAARPPPLAGLKRLFTLNNL